MGATAALATFATETSVSALPEDVANAARCAILDTIGVALAGSMELAARIVAEQACHQGGATECAVWGAGSWASAQNAALANGTAAHALDFDDTSDSMRGHPSAPILPAVYAIGERTRAPGRDVLASFAVGVEVACKLGLFTGQDPYDRGWHVTAAHGVIGATAGAARLAGLTTAQAQHAIGIAASFAGGLRGNFGTMTKPLHVGRAAQSAIAAVELAGRGLTANPQAIEGDVGYFAVFGRDRRYAGTDMGSLLGKPWDITEPGLNVKAYPCCASTHAAIDASLTVCGGLSLEDIIRVVAAVPYTAPLILIHHRPADPLSAKFSLEYCVATALFDGAVTLTHFTEENVRRQDLQALLRRVEHVVPPEWQEDNGVAKTGLARLDVYLRDGTVRHAETTEVRGSPTRPLSTDDLEAKFLSCARAAVGEGQAREILGLVRDFGDLDTLGDLSRLLAGAPSGRL
ncbi:MAG: MmgE/PrpD family protein [Chloroflexota bacterium]|nr:MmgE/PrpD family protein [Chloroflexota bacterium]